MVTMHDIAEAAGVSAMTVSNVINGRTAKVSPATVRRVLDLVEKMGYVPNAQARALAANRSGIVALVYAPGDRPLGGAHDGAFIAEADARVAASGRHLMLRAATSPVLTAAWLRTWKADGAILLGDVATGVDGEAELPLVSAGSGGDDFASDDEARHRAAGAVAQLIEAMTAARQ